MKKQGKYMLNMLAVIFLTRLQFMVKVWGRQLKSMIKYMLRDSVWAGEHCEFYQFSEGLRVIYNKAEHSFEEFSLNGQPIEEDREYSIGLQMFHFNNVNLGFNVTTEELESIQKPRMISTSCREVIDEYLSSHQHLDHRAGDRLIVK